MSLDQVVQGLKIDSGWNAWQETHDQKVLKDLLMVLEKTPVQSGVGKVIDQGVEFWNDAILKKGMAKDTEAYCIMY